MLARAERRSRSQGAIRASRTWSYLLPLMAAGASVGLHAAPAHACSPIRCLTPRVFPLGGDIPRDQFQLRWTPDANALREDDPRAKPLPRVFRVDGGRHDQVTLQVASVSDDPRSVILSVDPPLEPGAQLTLDVDAPACGGSDRSIHTTYTITDAAPPPSTLGTLQVESACGPLEVATMDGSCSAIVGVPYADVSVALSDEARPFEALMTYHLVVDGVADLSYVRAYGASTALPRGVERVVAACQPDVSLVNNIVEGTHHILMRVVLTDGKTLETPAVAIDLRCDDATRALARHYPGEPDDAGTPPAAPTNYPIHTTQRRQIKGCGVTQVVGDDSGWMLIACYVALCLKQRFRRS